jgi:hypothetical protein
MNIKSFLIVLAVVGTVFFATVNVVVNSNAPIKSNLTLLNLEAFTDEAGEAGGGVICVCTNAICGISITCNKQVYRNGDWITENTGNVCCCGYKSGSLCKSVVNSYVECDEVKHYCN